MVVNQAFNNRSCKYLLQSSLVIAGPPLMTWRSDFVWTLWIKIREVVACLCTEQLLWNSESQWKTMLQTKYLDVVCIFTITWSKFNVFKKMMRHCKIFHFATLNVCTSQLCKTLTTVKHHLAIKETSSIFCHFLSFHSLTFGFPQSKQFSPLIAVSFFVGKQATMDFWMHPSVDKTAIPWLFVNPFTLVHPWCRTTIFWHYCSRDEIECPLRFWICTHVMWYNLWLSGLAVTQSSTNTN